MRQKKINNLKEVAKRQRRRERKAAAMDWIYIWKQQRGKPWAHGICKWAVAGTGVNGCMQEHGETKINESAGELEVLREMRGCTEVRRQGKAREAIDNMNHALRVLMIGWRCSSGGPVSAEGCYLGGLPVDWMTPLNLIHSVIMPNGGKTMKKEK